MMISTGPRWRKSDVAWIAQHKSSKPFGDPSGGPTIPRAPQPLGKSDRLPDLDHQDM
jgi:hypothetical protein